MHSVIIKCSQCILTMKMHSYLGLGISLQDMYHFHFVELIFFNKKYSFFVLVDLGNVVSLGEKLLYYIYMKVCGVKCEIWVKSPTNKGQRLQMFLFMPDATLEDIWYKSIRYRKVCQEFLLLNFFGALFCFNFS